MKATITISAEELKQLLIDYFTKRGHTVESVGFNLREEGYRSGDTYKVFSHVAVTVDLDKSKKFEIYEAERPE